MRENLTNPRLKTPIIGAIRGMMPTLDALLSITISPAECKSRSAKKPKTSDR